MGRMITLFFIILLLLGNIAFANDSIFDLSRVSYFDNSHFRYIQTIYKSNAPNTSRSRIMPDEGEVIIDFQSRKSGKSYEIALVSKQDDEILFITEVVMDRLGRTEEYILNDNENSVILKYVSYYSEKEAVIERRGENGEYEVTTVSIDENTYGMMTIPYIIGTIDIESRERHILKALIMNGRKMDIFIQVVNREAIRVRDRIYNCYKLECGFMGIIGLFVPKLIFWVDEGTKIPVKYNMMGSSIIELDTIYD